MEVDKASLGWVLATAVASSLACEALAWFFVHRKEDYQRLSVQFVSASKRYTKAKDLAVDGKKDKKLVQLEKEFYRMKREVMAWSQRCNMLTAVFHMATFFSLKASYDGVVLARLPFVPYSFATHATHRNIAGEDMRDCGIIFIYMLCSLALKPNIAKLLGLEPPRSAGLDTEHAAKMTENIMKSMGVDVPGKKGA